MSRQSGFTRASSLGPIASFMERQGGSILRVLERVDLPCALLERPEMLVPLREQFRLLQKAARETGDAHFGASLGQHVRIRELSAFGKWVSEGRTLSQSLARAKRGLNTMLQTSTVLTLATDGPLAELSIEFLDPACDGRYQNELLGLSYLIDAVRCHAGRGWVPNVILTTAVRGSAKGALEQIFGANVSTGHRVSTIHFDRSLLDEEDSGAVAHPEDDRIFDEPPVPAERDELATIIAVTGLALCEDYPRIDWVAAKLGLTRRTLQRRLSESGTNFGAVVESLLLKSATRLLVDTAAPVTDIALRLGYADTAHFTRAFRRWTGASPSAYRAARN